MTDLATAEPALRVERRATARTPLLLDLELERAPGERLAVRALNLSCSGVLVRPATPVTLFSDITLHLPMVGDRLARVVRRDDDRYGCLFREPLTDEEHAALLALPEARAGEEEPAPPEPAPRRRLRLWRREERSAA